MLPVIRVVHAFAYFCQKKYRKDEPQVRRTVISRGRWARRGRNRRTETLKCFSYNFNFWSHVNVLLPKKVEPRRMGEKSKMEHRQEHIYLHFV